MIQVIRNMPISFVIAYVIMMIAIGIILFCGIIFYEKVNKKVAIISVAFAIMSVIFTFDGYVNRYDDENQDNHITIAELLNK